eukprot:GHVN01021463.1.p1 GENE.GHVN01021463.1~~GHVN01021463.1.p1  ORF type:complete len:356 (+),score=91.91 GHVN01021463.1:120-1187(+)
MSIVVFGSINCDITFNVDILPVPGETKKCESYNLTSGGKGANQALAASRAGADRVHLFGCIGNDLFSEVALKLLRESKIDLTHVNVSLTSPTGCASIHVDEKGENVIIVASGANNEAHQLNIDNKYLHTGTILVLTLETPLNETIDLIHRAHKQECFIILNYAPPIHVPAGTLTLCNLLVLNSTEARAIASQLNLTHCRYKDDVDLTQGDSVDLAEKIANTLTTSVIITLGANGVAVCWRQSPRPSASQSTSPRTPHPITRTAFSFHRNALSVRPTDTTGAGDTFVGVMSAMVLKYEIPVQRHPQCEICVRQAVDYAVVGSGMACEVRGAQPSIPHLEQIENRWQLSQVKEVQSE